MRYLLPVLLSLSLPTPAQEELPKPRKLAFKPSLTRLANTGLAGNVIASGGRYAAIAVPEGAQGLMDLNGDGDINDVVLFVHDATTGAIAAPALQVVVAEVVGARVIVQMREANQGNLDLNGDQDTDDTIALVYDVDEGTLTNSGLSIGVNFQSTSKAFALTADDVALLVSEQGEGVDLNGDGDAFDYVLHHWNLSSGAKTNLGLAVDGAVVVDGDVAYMRANESGLADLNGDGDTVDSVLHTYQFEIGLTQSAGFACARDPIAKDGTLAFFVSEAMQGGLDKNSDGDANDEVIYVYRVPTATIRALRYAIGSSLELGPHGIPFYSPFCEVSADHVAFLVSEAEEGGADLNFDGDGLDHVLFLYTVSTDTTKILRLATFEFALDDELLIFEVPEASQGSVDLNGDGDANDLVVHVRPLSGTTTENLGLAKTSGPIIVHTPFELSKGRAAFHVNEANQGFEDLNGDGDAGDFVLHIYSARTGLEPTIWASSEMALTNNMLFFAVREGSHFGLDLNGDGDVNDSVLFARDLFSGRTRSTGAVVSGFIGATHGRHRLFVTSEYSENQTDLNGDGDITDYVTQSVWIRP